MGTTSLPELGSSPDHILDELSQRSLIIVSGKGGVGRTTVAATLGAHLARLGKRVLVATTGHDDRLAWLFEGLDGSLDSSPREIAPSLWVQRLDARQCVNEFGELMSNSPRLAKLVLDNEWVRKMMRAIPGLDDFAVLGKAWHEAVRATRFDTVIFDGPATGHLRFNLAAPQSVLQAVSRGPLADEASAIESTLRDHRKTAAVLVGLPELWPLTELSELALDLKSKIGIHVAAIAINGVDLDGYRLLDMPGPADIESEAGHVGDLAAQFQKHRARSKRERDVLEEWGKTESGHACASIPRLILPWVGGLTQVSELRSSIEPTTRG